MTTLVTSREQLAALPPSTGATAVVMTMGALHEGHAQLITVARHKVGPQGRVIVTDFVNPRQFGAGEDFERYPRDLEADVAICSTHGADVVYAPSVHEVYPEQGTAAADISIDPGPLGHVLEGAARPGHFAGMLTVVAKLMHVTSPDIALFGEKDYQQLVLIKAMVRALDMSVDVVGVPTVRESDGLAMSSRNRYLDPESRKRAAIIPRALQEGAAVAQQGADAVITTVHSTLAREDLVADYVAVTDPDLGPAPATGEGRLLAAVPVAGTRLLDNMSIDLGAAT